MNVTNDSLLVSSLVGFDAQEWLETNVALIDDDNNLILIQHEYPGVVQGHYFLTTAKGRKAIELTEKAFQFIFNRLHHQLVFALPLVINKKAVWMCRQVGFTSYGTVDTPQGLCEMFILHRKDYKWAA